MNKRGQEEAGPVIGVEQLMWVLLSVAVLVFLIAIFLKLR